MRLILLQKLRILIVTAFCVGALSAVARAAESSSPQILVFGDSLSAAYGIREQEGWVTLLEQRLKREEIDLSVVNASVSGETTTGGRSR